MQLPMKGLFMYIACVVVKILLGLCPVSRAESLRGTNMDGVVQAEKNAKITFGSKAESKTWCIFV